MCLQSYKIGCADKTCFLMSGHIYNRCFKINIIHVVMFQVAVFLQKIPIQKCSLRLRQGYIFCVCNCRSLSIIYINTAAFIEERWGNVQGF